MALVKSNQHGALYKWGFEASDAPAISNFTARGADLKFEPEVVSMATDGEGHVDACTISKPVNRKITGTFTGYVADTFDPSTLPENFTFDGRFYLITGVSEPRRKGDYWEVSVEAISYAGITS